MPAFSLTSLVLGELTDLTLWEAELAADPVAVESALVSRLRQVPDRRAERGRRHPLVVILVRDAGGRRRLRDRDRTYLGARYMQLMPRLGKKIALAALEHSIVTAVRHMLTHDTASHDLGGNYYTKHDPDRALRRIT
ncbi:hypothetical protein ABZ468_46450 [Streptomyces sp. NPDC005708]|uniref:hypothetical protein n=1 Tax=unclassified Streptomyces TaxID=2593676 RepID=UPI003400C45A